MYSKLYLRRSLRPFESPPSSLLTVFLRLLTLLMYVCFFCVCYVYIYFRDFNGFYAHLTAKYGIINGFQTISVACCKLDRRRGCLILYGCSYDPARLLSCVGNVGRDCVLKPLFVYTAANEAGTSLDIVAGCRIGWRSYPSL